MTTQPLLLPYRLETTPSPATADHNTPRFGKLRLTVGDDTQGRSDQVVRCTRITVTMPAITSDPAPLRQPLSITTAAPTVHERAHGREWWIVPNTTHPAATVFTLLPEEPAHFDGTWQVTFLIETDPGFETTTVHITEETATGNSDITARTARIPTTVLPATPSEGHQ
ncbi:hypothetical protein OG528_29000 [Streptomyces platensis]|uniref:hypothetical protein n=1 Tax=Streptomyces platensis TaxID=58346 RepID=UPI0030DEF742